MLRGLLTRQILRAPTTQFRLHARFASSGRVAPATASQARGRISRRPPTRWVPSLERTFTSPANAQPAAFPACGRPTTPRAASSDENDMAALPKSEGAEALAAQSCADLGACSRETPRLTPEQIVKHALSVPTWVVSEDSTKITRSFTAKNWACAFAFLNDLSTVAETEGHHPDVHLTNYRDVKVVLTTHAIGGLSMHDFVLAAKLDAINVTYSPKWLRENASPDA